jgi:hypothetical protein
VALSVCEESHANTAQESRVVRPEGNLAALFDMLGILWLRAVPPAIGE